MSATTAKAEAAPLDEVMLAMDVVDTLRHRQDLVERELDASAREARLIDKLRDIYAHQGIEVTDRVLREGVKALEESRFVYTPPKPGFDTWLAGLYVGRRRWGPAALALILVLVLGLGGYFLAWRPIQNAQLESARVELSEKLPQQMDAIYQAIFDETKVQKAVEDADKLIAQGKTAAAEGDRDGALAALSALTELRDQIRREYQLRIVSRPGERSAFWRIPEVNTAATNYYLVVEAIAPDGEVLTLAIENEETGKTERVSKWGIRVPESTYRSVETDKSDDGIVQQSMLGFKEYGFLEPRFVVPVMNGAVTRW